MHRLAKLISILLLLNVSLARGEDSKGNYWIGGGVGSVGCPQFVAAMEKDRSIGIGSPGYAGETFSFFMYIAGFQTGFNASKADTCDVFPEIGHYELLSWVENYCRKTPSKKFGQGVVALGLEFYPKRKKICQ